MSHLTTSVYKSKRILKKFKCLYQKLKLLSESQPLLLLLYTPSSAKELLK